MCDSCPSQEILKQYVHADLPEQEADKIGTHIARCPSCRIFVECIEQQSGDTFLKKLRNHTPVSSGVADMPSRIGPYKILERISEGGMGTVYRAFQDSLQREVALKVVRGSRLDSPEVLGRFKREILVAGQLQHPNIVQAYDAGTDGKTLYFVMEFLHGRDLSDVIRHEGALPFSKALSYVKQAAVGLAHAHKAGIVHRDIKPSNLFLTDDGIVKLLDLGLSCSIQPKTENAETTRTEVGQLVGSPDFMAPEQIRHGKIDPRTDIYSLGCTFYYLLTGEPPYPTSRHSTLAEKIAAHLHVPLPRHPNIGPIAQTLIEKMTAKNPEERFQSVEELLAALENSHVREFSLRLSKPLILTFICAFIFAAIVLFVINRPKILTQSDFTTTKQEPVKQGLTKDEPVIDEPMKLEPIRTTIPTAETTSEGFRIRETGELIPFPVLSDIPKLDRNEDVPEINPRSLMNRDNNVQKK